MVIKLKLGDVKEASRESLKAQKVMLPTSMSVLMCLLVGFLINIFLVSIPY